MKDVTLDELFLKAVKWGGRGKASPDFLRTVKPLILQINQTMCCGHVFWADISENLMCGSVVKDAVASDKPQCSKKFNQIFVKLELLISWFVNTDW